jgi:hypothetical protein
MLEAPQLDGFRSPRDDFISSSLESAVVIYRTLWILDHFGATPRHSVVKRRINDR